MPSGDTTGTTASRDSFIADSHERSYRKHLDTMITVADNAGFCFGVKRAVSLVDDALNGNDRLFMLGELIHNKDFSDRLIARGAQIITPDDIYGLDPEKALVFIRAHGEQRETFEKLERLGLRYVDATCPYVRKIHDIVSSRTNDGTHCLIIGSASHPEVVATASFCNGGYTVCGSVDELAAAVLPNGHIIAVSQTTHSLDDWIDCTKLLRSIRPDAEIYDTVCRVTQERQRETERLAAESDAVFVIGGLQSANTTELYEIAQRNCDTVYRLENAAGLTGIPLCELKALKGKRISITAGASTPEDITQEVIFAMTEIIGDVSFADMLNEAFKTVHTGERVTGTVSMVCPAEIHVDLGTKHTGILPYDEIATDSSVDLMNEFHVGDKIDVVVIKLNDSEGTVLLSKKRFDADKNWQVLEAAYEANEILTGKVKEVVKGGVIIGYNGTRVFVPASQTGIARDGDMSVLVGQEEPFRIIETNPYKKRVVASIRNAKRSIRKQAAANFYETAEVGQKIHGTVRSLTSFGAFVDLGGVDGLVHITELSWGRLRKPEDVLKVGDEIDVYIKYIDKEKKRISLGYKTEANNPWNIFVSKYNVGDVVDVKVVSIMTYGAFAEIINDVDGLIHISQLATEPVANVKDVVKIGDVLTVKIVAIDYDAHRINLSRKAVLEDEVSSDEPKVYSSDDHESAKENADE